MFLIIVDAHSKWMEVYKMAETTTAKTIDVLRDVFSRFGLPEVMVSDNGPQFVCSEMMSFMESLGVEHKRSAPYHPQSNGEAERAVQTFKAAMKAIRPGGHGFAEVIDVPISIQKYTSCHHWDFPLRVVSGPQGSYAIVYADSRYCS